MDKLVELNLLVDAIAYRDPSLWVDESPPERDLELGVGKHVAWQTLLPQRGCEVCAGERGWSRKIVKHRVALEQARRLRVK